MLESKIPVTQITADDYEMSSTVIKIRCSIILHSYHALLENHVYIILAYCYHSNNLLTSTRPVHYLLISDDHQVCFFRKIMVF